MPINMKNFGNVDTLRDKKYLNDLYKKKIELA